MWKISKREVAHVAAMVGMLVVGVRCAGEPEHVRPTSESALLVNDRQSLAVCVQLDPALEGPRKAEILRTLEKDLVAVRSSHPDWEFARYGQEPVRVQLGCPGAVWPQKLMEKGSVVGPGTTMTPSEFRTFVYVVDDAKASAVLGTEEAAQGIAELMREDEHVLVEVSSALVVRASALGTSSFQQRWLPMGVGLKSLQAIPEPVSDSLPKAYPPEAVTQ